jgi:uncharacterized protein
VVEIHIAGGITHEGFLLDVHSDLVPDAVWSLLELILPHTPNLCAITYELLEFSLPMLGEEKILSQLALAQSAWKNYCRIHNTPTHRISASTSTKESGYASC